MRVFWSWQSDTPGKIGRHFVKEAITTAIDELKIEAQVNEPDGRDLHASLHRDYRKGIPGSTDLARIILEKIAESAVFIADVTPVGAVSANSDSSREKKLINANVAIELGYALGRLGDGALLMVMNEHYGAREELPRPKSKG